MGTRLNRGSQEGPQALVALLNMLTAILRATNPLYVTVEAELCR